MNATSGLGLEKVEGASSYRVLLGEGTLLSKIQPTAYERLQIIPSELDLCGADIEVARHARAEGADVSLADLFLASALGDLGKEGGAPDDESADKPVQLSKKELAEWAEIFTRRGKSAPSGDAEPEN